MSVVIVAEWSAKPGYGDEVLDTIRTVIADKLAFDGCEDVTVLRAVEDGDRLVLVERWASADRYTAYQRWRRSTGTQGQIRDLLSVPPHIRRFDEVGF